MAHHIPSVQHIGKFNLIVHLQLDILPRHPLINSNPSQVWHRFVEYVVHHVSSSPPFQSVHVAFSQQYLRPSQPFVQTHRVRQKSLSHKAILHGDPLSLARETSSPTSSPCSLIRGSLIHVIPRASQFCSAARFKQEHARPLLTKL